MIIPLVIISIIIIIWIQFPDIKDDPKKPVYKRIFERIKLPVIIICLLLILYSFPEGSSSCTDVVNNKIFMTIPDF
jgi:hypothetical protein